MSILQHGIPTVAPVIDTDQSATCASENIRFAEHGAAESRPMKLQVKDAGSWRDVIRFDAAREGEARAAGSALMRCIDNQKATLRTIDGAAVQAYCAAPDGVWRPA